MKRSALWVWSSLLLSTVFLTGCGSSDPVSPHVAPVLSTAARPALGAEEMVVATVNSSGAHEVAAEIDGRIIQLLAHVGDHVRTGQLLAVIDTEQVELQTNEASANLEAARTALDAAAREARRLEHLHSLGAVSQVEAQAAADRLDQARSDHAVAASRRAMTRLTTAKGEVRAPSSGVISSRDTSLSSVVAAGSVLFRLESIGALDILAPIPPHFAETLRIDDTLRFTFGDQEGQVRFLGLSRRSQATGVRSGRFTVVAGAPPVGTVVQLWLRRTSVENEVVVPLSAVLADAKGGRYVMKIEKDGRIARTSVAVTALVSEGAQLKGDLRPGDVLVAVGGARLQPGQAVRPLPFVS